MTITPMPPQRPRTYGDLHGLKCCPGTTFQAENRAAAVAWSTGAAADFLRAAKATAKEQGFGAEPVIVAALVNASALHMIAGALPDMDRIAEALGERPDNSGSIERAGEDIRGALEGMNSHVLIEAVSGVATALGHLADVAQGFYELEENREEKSA